ncbi:MAG TPA: DNA primase [Candidatus Ozemobacteraceae bacterium]
MALINDAVIAEVRGRIDIVQFVGEYVRLTHTGRTFKGLCPFHQEKTPSFYVVPDKQIFHCFGCSKGGDVFRFLMEAEHLTFPEAIRQLARRAGVAIPIEKDPEYEKKARLYQTLDDAAKFYTGQLHQTGGKQAREYLKQRGITPETAARFRIGYAPDTWDALATTLGKGAERLQLLEKTGLVKQRATGSGCYDTFRHRLIIPIADTHGRIVGFGGRVLGKGEEPKYLNSPETELFNKRKMLFNFRDALQPIRRSNAAIVVEGYLDVISLVQAGITNVVATLGTAITAEQVALLARNGENVYFCYDADEAGQRATVRAISLQRDTPLTAKVITFDDPKDDPDSFVRREGAEGFIGRINAARDIYTFLVETKTRGMKPPLEIAVKERLVREFKDLVPAIHSPVARSEVIRMIARLIDTDPGALEIQFANRTFARTESGTAQPGRSRPVVDGMIRRQEWVLKHLIEHPEELDRTRAMLAPADFTDTRLQQIFTALCRQQEASGGKSRPADIIAALEDPELVSRFSELLIELEEKPVEPFLECVYGLVKSRLKRESEELLARIRNAERDGREQMVAELTQQQLELRRKMEALNQRHTGP